MKGNFVVIGGSQGIGLATAKMINHAGGRVTVISRQASSSEAASFAECIDQDVLNLRLVKDQLPEEINGLIYCPGSINLKPFKSLKADAFRADYEINVIGAIESIQAALPGLKKGINSSIVLFSTVAVQQGMPFHASVAAAKGAVEGLTRSLAAELAPKIRVNCIAPSLVDTPLAAKLLSNERQQEGATNRHPMKRYGQPDDIANMAVMLLSEQASWVSGQVIGVDGGLSRLRV